jgi:hypothetical protein
MPNAINGKAGNRQKPIPGLIQTAPLRPASITRSLRRKSTPIKVEPQASGTGIVSLVRNRITTFLSAVAHQASSFPSGRPSLPRELG